MNPDDKKVFYDKEEIDTTLDTMLDTLLDSKLGVSSIDTIDVTSIYPSMMTSKDRKYSLGEMRVYTSLNENVLLEAFRSIAFEEPNDLAKTLIEYYYELKHKPEGERITILKKKLEDEYRINL